MIYSLQVEKHCLAGLVKFPDVFAEVAPYLIEKDFFDDVHRTIFLVIKSCFDKREHWDKVILAEKIKNIGVVFKDEINIYDYIDNLSYITINQSAVLNAAKELIKLRIRRDLEELGDKIKSFVRENGNLPADEIIGGIDSIFGDKVSIYEPESNPANLYEGLEKLIEERGNNPLNETGLKTAFPEFNRLYGGLKPQNVYAIASRPGVGKSTFINDLCLKTAEINNIKTLILDTEMSLEEVSWRAAAARSGVAQWYLETGQWRKNPEMIKKIRDAHAKNKAISEKDFVFHYHIGNKNLDQICSIVRRWKYKNIKAGEPFIIGYDYLKMTMGDHVSKNWAEYQEIGTKVDKLKRLSEELNAVVFTAIQLNRGGESFNKKSSSVTDDATSISMSDRLQWVASFVALFRRKTVDEIVLDGENFGTHKLIPVKTRFQGKDAAGHHDLVKRKNVNGDFEFVNNYLNYRIDNFDVSEIGSLRDIVAAQSLIHSVDDKNLHDTHPL